jgi:hypothetical protein
VKHLVLSLSLCSVFLLAGCPDTGIVCSPGTVRCGQGCIDPAADAKNCGGCGNACRSGQVCVSSGCVCGAGAVSCNGECTVRETDPRNCGACGHSCGTNEICEAGACKLNCPQATVLCGPNCIDTRSDPGNCGSCGNACAAGQVCEQGNCQQNCSNPGSTRCVNSCVDLKLDSNNCGSCSHACLSIERCDAGACETHCPANAPNRCADTCVDLNSSATNCGACGATCENSQNCHGGHCAYDLVAACFSTGQLVGLQQSTEFRGPAESLGTAPTSLASYRQVVLSLDGIDQKLYQARAESVNGHAFAKLPRANATGSIPNQVLADPPYVYVVNSGSGTLQVLQDFADAGVFPDGGSTAGDGGIALATIGELPFGANTYPQAAVKVGNALWVPLYGGFGAMAAAAGQKVVRVDVSVPTAPVVTDTVDLSGLDLKPFDGGSTVARPYGIISHQGSIYVALNNLNASTYVAEGPGLLAKINPTSKAVSLVDLGADKCLDAVSLVSAGTRLLVSCVGNTEYSGPPYYELVRTEKAGIVLLDSNDVRQSTWTPACPAAADGGSGCTPILMGRFAYSGGRLYVGDGNGGRIFVLDVNGNTLTERRGYSGDAGAAISACTPDPVTNLANVADVLVTP